MYKISLVAFGITAIAATANIGLATSNTINNQSIIKKADIDLKYDIYASYIRVSKLKFSININNNSYLVESDSKPKGLASIFSDSELEMSSKGIINNGIVVPKNFTMVKKKDGKKKQVTKVTWNEKQHAKAKRTYDIPSYKAKAIKENMQRGLPDPLSLMLSNTINNTEKPCSTSSKVYNGKEIYSLTYKYIGNENFKNSSPGIYKGSVVECTLNFKPIAGYSKKKMKKFSETPINPIKIWLAPLKVEKDKEILIPVAAKTDYKGYDIVIKLKKASPKL